MMSEKKAESRERRGFSPDNLFVITLLSRDPMMDAHALGLVHSPRIDSPRKSNSDLSPAPFSVKAITAEGRFLDEVDAVSPRAMGDYPRERSPRRRKD
jgi:hypothetical protein